MLALRFAEFSLGVQLGVLLSFLKRYLTMWINFLHRNTLLELNDNLRAWRCEPLGYLVPLFSYAAIVAKDICCHSRMLLAGIQFCLWFSQVGIILWFYYWNFWGKSPSKKTKKRMNKSSINGLLLYIIHNSKLYLFF